MILFARLYKYFQANRLHLMLPLVLVFALALYGALTIEPIEDISEMLPMDNETEQFNELRKNIRFNERIIIVINQKDTLAELKPDLLAGIADSLYSNIYAKYPDCADVPPHEILASVEQEIYDIFYRNLPIFLEEDDYQTLDNLMTDSAIELTLEQNFKSLISPAGSFTQKYITQDPFSITGKALKRLENLKPDDSFILHKGHVFSSDQKHVLLFIDLKSSETSGKCTSKILNGISDFFADYNRTDSFIDYHVFGAPVVAAGNSQRIKTDILFTVALAMVFLILFLTVFFRRLEIFAIIFLPAVFGAAVSVAVIHLVQGSVSLISLGIGSILTGISIDYSLHLINHARKEKQMIKVLEVVSKPILISSFSTATAFGALLFVSSKALQDLGMFAAISVLAAALFALIVLPHIIKSPKGRSASPHWVERIASYKYHRSRPAFFVLLLFTVMGFVFVGKAEFEGDMDRMNYMTPETRTAQKKLNEISGLAYRTLYIAAMGENLGDALDKLYPVGGILDSLKNEQVIESYSSAHSVLIAPKLQKQRIRKWNNYFCEATKDTIQEKLTEYGKKFGFRTEAFRPFYQHLEKKFTVLEESESDFQKLRQLFAKDLITETPEGTVALSVINIKEENKPKVSEHLPDSEYILIFDHKAFTDSIIEILKKDFNRLVKISLVAVFLILLLYYGRIELTVITFLPLLLSWLWTLGLMALFGLKFTIFNIIISTFIFGLGIDYSIFIMQALLHNYRYGKHHLPIFKTSVLLSGITTIVAIGVLIFAKHPAIRSIALLSVTGIVSVIFAAYTLQPLMFNFLVKQQGKKRSLPVNAKDLFFSLAVIFVLFIGSVLSLLVEIVLKIVPVSKPKKKLFFHHWIRITLKAIHYVPLNIDCQVKNPFGEKFKKPSIIIANHQAHLDIALLLMLHPKILILTNDWVQKNFFYGRIVKYADYLPTSNGLEKNCELLEDKINDGYSLLIFPEGTRSPDSNIQRFHKGAFYYARRFDLDILPIILHGTGDCIPKGEPFLKSGQIRVEIQQRIAPKTIGNSLREQAKAARLLMLQQYSAVKFSYEKPKYFRHKIIGNYLYKGPVLEHYARIKIKSEAYYESFHKECPKRAVITDIGCGYGFMAYMLHFLSPKRKILGIDYDSKKIETAKHNISKAEATDFLCSDSSAAILPRSDVFILADVLHYMTKEEQIKLLKRCLDKMNPAGKIIIRDGNSEMKKKHKGTKLSEFFSVKVLNFNTAKHGQLFFLSKSDIEAFAQSNELIMRVEDNTRHTSNLVYILTRKSL